MNTINQADLALLLQTAQFAAHKHRQQRRMGKDRIPYINHPIDVAELLLRVGKIDDIAIIAAALLHDTLEDTNTTSTELEQTFGRQVCAYVEEVSDDMALSSAQRKALQVEHAPALSMGAKLIKLADKIANVRDIANNPPPHWSATRQLDYINWAAQVVAALGTVNSELEQLFATVHRQAVNAIEQLS